MCTAACVRRHSPMPHGLSTPCNEKEFHVERSSKKPSGLLCVSPPSTRASSPSSRPSASWSPRRGACGGRPSACRPSLSAPRSEDYGGATCGRQQLSANATYRPFDLESPLSMGIDATRSTGFLPARSPNVFKLNLRHTLLQDHRQQAY